MRPTASPPAGSGPPLTLTLMLPRAVARLLTRLAVLEQQLDAGDASAWPAYLAVLDVLLRLTAATKPGASGELLTTKAMAERLGIQPKALLRRVKQNTVRPAVKAGKFIRWRGTEAIR